MRIQISLCLLLVCFCSSFFGLHSILVSGRCLDSQKLLLLALKNDLNFDPSLSTKLVGWNQSVDCCDWGGVTCDKAGHVIGLDLSNEFIAGGFNGSSSLFRLGFLKSLNLAYNSFNSAELPSGFGKLTQVNYLNLSNANFEGQVPGDFSLMKKLVTLDLSSSPYSSLVLENPDLKMLIQNLTEVRELHLDNIKIITNGYHWSSVISSFLPNLQVLSLKGCDLSGPLDSSLAMLKNLSFILLDENTFSSEIPESFANLKNLTVLSLRACNLSGSLPKKIFQIPTLKTIDLSSNVILKGPLPVFPENGSLENLVLSYTEVGGTLPDSIGSLPLLSRIELRGCKFTGPIPVSMQNLTRLVYLDLSSNLLTGSIPSFQLSKNLVSVNFYKNNLTGGIPSFHWEGLNRLQFLDLSYNSLIGNFPESLLTLPSLEYIYLSNNGLSGQISKVIDVSSYQLRDLDLSSNKFVGPIPGFIFKLPALSTLTLSKNNFNGIVDLDMFGKSNKLYALDLSYNDLTVRVKASKSSFSSLSELNTLKLASCKMQQLPYLKNQTRLMMLDLSDNELSGEIPNWIWEVGNGYLRFLNMSHNKFSSLQKPYTFPFLLDVLDLHSNYLEGDIPIPPRRVYHLDYSNNNFGSSIPVNFGNVLTSTLFFSISNNKLVGVIPQSIRNATSLRILDLSHNTLTGPIPVIGNLKDLQSLDLSVNKLNGSIPEELANLSLLSFLNVSYNHLSGKIPQGSQFQTFTELSFKGNKELCGPPLNKSCDKKRI